MPKVKKTCTKYWQGYRATRTLINYPQEYKMVQPVWKTVWQFLYKIKHGYVYSTVHLFHI